MANAFYLANATAIAMMGGGNNRSLAAEIDAGTAAVIEIYDNTSGVPADADASIGSAVLLATLTCSATAFSGVADDTPGALATFNAITSDSSADATGTAAFFRIKTQSGGTVIAQGTVGTSSADMIVNTTAFTSGSTIACSAATILFPEGP